MIDQHVYNRKSPKYYIRKYLEANKNRIKQKVVLDIPAGNGVTTELLAENGAKPEAFDLFPQYFMLKNFECKKADILDHVPVKDHHADMIICQEGIEHFSDQVKAFKEFNRILKPQGELIITTPTYSNLAARFSYLLFESENNKKMPPNELDDVWMSLQENRKQMYYGHVFLIGIQKLRTLAKLTGFKIKENRFVRISKGSLFLFPILYPFILISSFFRYIRNINRQNDVSKKIKKAVYKEQLLLNINPKILLNHHTFIIFEKEKEHELVDFRIENTLKQFGTIM